MNKNFIALLFVTSLYSFSLKNGYKLALENDMDSLVNSSNLQSIKYDEDIADSLSKPTIDLTGKIQRGKNSKTDININNSNDYGAKITQKLFDGYEAKYEKKLQRARYISAKYYLIESQNKLAYSYVESYINVLKQKELLALKVESVIISEDILHKVYKKISSGYGGKIEFEQAKNSYTKSKVDLSIQKINYKDAIESLKYFVQKDFDSNDLIKPQFYYTIPSSLDNALANLTNKNPTYLAAKLNVQVALWEQKRDLKTNYPNVALVGSYNKYNNSSPYDDYKIGLEVNYTLYNGGKDEALNKKALQKIKEKKFLLQKSKYQVNNKLKLAWNSYILNGEKKTKQESYLEAKKSLLEATIAEFDLGAKTLNNLLDEQNSYISIKGELLVTTYDYLLAQYKILESIGTLSAMMANPTLTLEKQLSSALNSNTLNKPDEFVVPSARIMNIDKIISKKDKKVMKAILNTPVSNNKDSVNDIKSLDDIISTELKVKKTLSSTSKILFKEKFIDATSDKYTINLAYFKNENRAKSFLNRYNLNDNAFYFSFGQEKTLYKIMMGIYDSRKDAQDVLNNLPTSLKRSQPRVESIIIKQKLYKKYHNSTPISKIKYNQVSKVIPEKIIRKKVKIIDKYKNFKNTFLNAPKNKYTINLAFFQSERNAKNFIKKNKLEKTSFNFSFGKNKKFQKIMMGVFDTKEEAKKALENLSTKLKRSKPRIESISIKQDLYSKYHKNEPSVHVWSI